MRRLPRQLSLSLSLFSPPIKETIAASCVCVCKCAVEESIDRGARAVASVCVSVWLCHTRNEKSILFGGENESVFDSPASFLSRKRRRAA